MKELNPPSSAPVSQTDIFDEPPPSRPALAASMSSHTKRPVTPAPPENAAPEAVEPSYVNTSRELEDIFSEMHGYFDGRETEHNWMKREESMTRLRRLIAGNAATDFHDPFLAGLRALLDGIIKGAVSLRTSLSKEACSLVQDIAQVYGPAMDPMVEIIMQTFIKLTAATKKIASAQANTTVDIIVSRVTYNTRIMQHIWFACQDKNVQPRLYASGWLKTVLNKEAHHKNHVEHAGGLDLVEKCIKKGLADANPGVREKMRATYWVFAGIWPAKAEAIMGGLDSTAARLLQNDPNNPKSPKKPEGGVRPGLGLSKSTMGTSKPSVREAMMAQKRAMTTSTTTKTLPTRPGSAMSHFSPAKSTSAATHVTSTTATVRTKPESTLSTGGISGAPMRPGRRRPEMAARPATAGPYSVRSHDQPSAEQTSPPSRPRPKAVTPKSISSSPKRTVPKTVRPFQPASPEEPRLPTPTKIGTLKGLASPRSTPSRMVPPSLNPPSSSPSKAHEEFSLVVPVVNTAMSPLGGEQPVGPSVMDEDVEMSISDAPRPLAEPPLLVPDSPPQTSADIREAVDPVAASLPVVEAPPPTPPSVVRSLEVYEDPATREQQVPSPKPILGPVLGDRSVNEDAAILQQAVQQQQQQQQQQKQQGNGELTGPALSPEKIKQNTRLLDSGISKVQQKSLDVHGFRKLQGIIRDSDTAKSPTGSPPLLTDAKFDALLAGLFDYLETPLAALTPEKTQDVKAQVLATIRLLLKRMRASFQPHVARGLESLLRARAAYEGRTHIVSGLELLAADLAALGDASEIVIVLCRMLSRNLSGAVDDDGQHAGEDKPVAPPSTTSSDRSLSMGLHVLKELMDARGPGFVPTDNELDALAGLAGACLESAESAVRMDAVLLCVALHARVGDARFWEAIRARGVKEDPKSLITYYIVRKQREVGGNGTVVG